MSCKLNESELLGRKVKFGGKTGVITDVISLGATAMDIVYRVRFEDGSIQHIHDSFLRPFLSENKTEQVKERKMKKFKDLSNFLKESEYSPWGSVAQSAGSPSVGVYKVEDSEQLNAINAVLEAYSNKSFINPRAAMGQLKTKLNLAGLDFDFNSKDAIDEGTKEYALSRFGGEFGTTPEHDLRKGFYESDGISPYNNGVGFVLKCTYNINENGLYSIKAMVVPDAKDDSDDVED